MQSPDHCSPCQVYPIDLQAYPGIENLYQKMDKKYLHHTKTAFGFYVNSKPFGTLIIVNRTIAFDDHFKFYVRFSPDHEFVRSMMHGPKKRNLKMLRKKCEQSMTQVYGRNVTLEFEIKPIAKWGDYMGGLKYLLPLRPG